MQTLTQPNHIAAYKLQVLATGLTLYAKTGIRPNRHLTATKMVQLATQATGQKFGRNYLAAAAACRAQAQALYSS